MSAATLNPIRKVSFLPTTADCQAQQNRFVSSWQSGQTLAALARHLLLLAYDSTVVAMDKTYLVELAIDVRLFGGKETKVSQQRAQAETSR